MIAHNHFKIIGLSQGDEAVGIEERQSKAPRLCLHYADIIRAGVPRPANDNRAPAGTKSTRAALLVFVLTLLVFGFMIWY